MEIIISFIQRAILQGTPLLFGATGEILTEKSGNLNLGIPGIMYIGAISGVVGGFFYQNSAARVQPVPAILIPLLCCLAGSLLTSLLYCFLTVTLKANQNVTGLAITTFGVGVGNFFGGSLIKIVKSDVPYLALVKIAKAYKTTLPFASGMGPIGQLFFSYGFLVYLAVILAVAVSLFLSRSRAGLYLRAVGENPAAVAPPSTHCGMVVSTAENFGMIPASSKNAPVSAKTLRFTTLFVATIPTFWEYVAVGRPPSSAVRMLLTP